ncbi:SMP-30/gluconolactonase/LRE family protein [Geodermatophilus sp. YIM 151500]|uniref:SMP-30/gluconolactonase/LRE family protein n=1 Tax=Geodermatophilus sp. YIM 151500 TaxID=2984531 RepID=UPI0021E3D3D4|nr:SMP-30/gluconolactonase/LRE family protein [Geodermatophilus sp. YIM 151500]MCV2491940.1 SMP-30/gluconolactonase/LRE family protein [Geodermatophilus sp. YIM 151500]
MNVLPTDAFIAADTAFTAVTGARPALSRLVRWNAHEGPTYLPAEDALYVTTVPGGRPPRAQVVRIALDGDGPDLDPERVTVVPGDVVMPNGMTGWGTTLLVCEQGGLESPARLSRLDPVTGATTTVVDTCGSRPLNSPNDVVVRRDGTIWFTDPSYGHLQGFRPAPELPDALYRFDPATGRLRMVADDFDKPNGLVFSPDGTVLYVADSGAVHAPDDHSPDRPHHVYAHDVVGGDALGSRRVVDVTTAGTPDGLAVDEDGRLYVCSADGIRVLTPDGALLGRIAVPGGAVNLTFGGRDRDRLFITADTAVWVAVLNTRGA